ncbi:ephrin type-A receptor 4-A-like [Pollicipes pollicipes]|uniref:ephrin type-A receptor 4-A-like n=1 Tax=Pollicipes pollicipes TaxID=41117 RepID=UPI001884B986|nr:ephrin type-A receptor 4-A-like [Pollicipes pollicipes]
MAAGIIIRVSKSGYPHGPDLNMGGHQSALMILALTVVIILMTSSAIIAVEVTLSQKHYAVVARHPADKAECREIVVGLALFPTTPTGNGNSTIRVRGKCVKNAEIGENGQIPQLTCKRDGTWRSLSGLCRCKKGYAANPTDWTCKAVAQRTHLCPDHSSPASVDSAACPCDAGFYRAPADRYGCACTQPPSAPRHLEAEAVDQSTVVLAWGAPLWGGGRADTIYSVSCERCGASVTFSPAQTGLRGTRVHVSGLSPATSYRFRVYSRNGVSPVAAGEDEHQTIDLTTQSSDLLPRRASVRSTSHLKRRSSNAENGRYSFSSTATLVVTCIVTAFVLVGVIVFMVFKHGTAGALRSDAERGCTAKIGLLKVPMLPRKSFPVER